MLKCTWVLVLCGLAAVGCADDSVAAGAGGSGAVAGVYGGSGGIGANGGVGGSAAVAGTAGWGGVGGAGNGGSSGMGTSDGGGVDAARDGAMPLDSRAIAEPTDEASYLFDQTQVRTYNIVIAPADLSTLNGNPMAEAYVPASLEFDGNTFNNLRVRYKGGFGAFLSPCSGSGLQPGGPKTGKCSIKLAFDQVDPNGRFFGLRKLNFHSMNNDESMLRDRLGYSLFRDSGIAAPRSAHVRVLINGNLEGLFALVEQVDGRFTRSRFTEGGEGNLYKEIWPMHADASAYLNALETNEDEMPSVQAMLDFRAAIEQGATAAESYFDRDYLMKYVAIDRVIINDDGVFHWWCTNEGAGNNPGGIGNHNYYWYQEAARDHFWLIPWDFDNAFNVASMVTVWPAWNASAACTCASMPFSFPPVGQRPASCDRLTQHFVSWMADFNQHTDAFLAGPFAAPAVNAKLDAWIAQIRPFVVEAAGRNGAPTESAWNTAVSALRTSIDNARTNRGYRY